MRFLFSVVISAPSWKKIQLWRNLRRNIETRSVERKKETSDFLRRALPSFLLSDSKVVFDATCAFLNEKFDGEMKLNEQKRKYETDLKIKDSYYLQKIAPISQRYLLEKLFGDVAQLYATDAQYRKLVTSNFSNTQVLSNINSGDPKMTSINLILWNEEVWRYYLNVRSSEFVHFPRGLKESGLIYGSLSEIVHSPELRRIIYDQDIDPLMKRFYGKLAELFKTTVLEYDAGEAAMATREGIVPEL